MGANEKVCGLCGGITVYYGGFAPANCWGCIEESGDTSIISYAEALKLSMSYKNEK